MPKAKFFSPLLKRIRAAFWKKEDTAIGTRFVEGIEIVYSIILACGVVKIIDIVQTDVFQILRNSWQTILISGLFILRFYFAPSQNLRILGDRARGWKWTIMPFDGLILLGFSFCIYFMCLNIQNPETFYRIFFYLLYINAVWILLILARAKSRAHNRIWLYNNLAFVILYLILPERFQTWFLLALLNSLIDLGLTYSEYFKS